MKRHGMAVPGLLVLISLGALPWVACVDAENISEEADQSGASISVDNQTVPIVALASGKCVDVPGSSQNSGVQIQQWDCNGTGAQKFTFRPVAGGAYQIVNKTSGKCLDVYGGSKDTGAKIIQWDCHSGDNQKFHLSPIQGTGGVALVAVHSGKCVDVPGGSTATGVKLQQWDCNQSKAQAFHPDNGGGGTTSSGGGTTTSGGGTTSSGGGPDGYDYREECMKRVNGFRATIGLPALVRRKDLEDCADAEAKSDFQTNRAHGAFGQCQESVGQCECPNYKGYTPQQIVEGCMQQMWDEGPGPFDQGHGHYDIMSSPDAKGVACGIYQENGNTWAIQNYYN